MRVRADGARARAVGARRLRARGARRAPSAPPTCVHARRHRSAREQVQEAAAAHRKSAEETPEVQVKHPKRRSSTRSAEARTRSAKQAPEVQIKHPKSRKECRMQIGREQEKAPRRRLSPPCCCGTASPAGHGRARRRHLLRSGPSRAAKRRGNRQPARPRTSSGTRQKLCRHLRQSRPSAQQ